MIKRASINSAPAVLNIGDKAMWVTGWNEAVDALEVEHAKIDDLRTHPAPPPAKPTVKQPMSTERAELINALDAGSPSRQECHAASDMLEADAQEIDKLKKNVAYEQTLGDIHFAARNRLEAQQVAAPQPPQGDKHACKMD